LLPRQARAQQHRTRSGARRRASKQTSRASRREAGFRFPVAGEAVTEVEAVYTSVEDKGVPGAEVVQPEATSRELPAVPD